MARQPTRQPERATAREEVLPGGLVGRNGEMLYRNVISDDAFEVPEKFKEDGWDYQWTRVFTYGEPDEANLSTSLEAGWRPVPQRAMPGYLGAKKDSEEAITYKDMMLMERPLEFTLRARRENEANARRLLVAQHERFELALPSEARGTFNAQKGSINYGAPEQAESQTYPHRGYRTGEIPVD
jgi:hypothetical protein